jgi:hypothetical protein
MKPKTKKLMKTLSQFLDRIANGKLLILLFLIYAIFPAYFLKNAEEKINQLAGKKVGVIDLTVGFNQQKTLQMVADYGDEARAYYARTEMTTDVIYPIVYAFLFGVILSLLYRNKAYKPFSWINLLPFVALIFDYLENICIVSLLQNYPSQSLNTATFCEVFKILKWIAFVISVVLILYGLIRLLLTKFSKNAT